MSRKFGSQSMIGELQVVIVRRPDQAFGSAVPEEWHYTGPIDLENAQSEHDNFVKLLQSHGIEVIYHHEPLPTHADAIFVHDPAIVCDKGAIILQMGKDQRKGEAAALEKTLTNLGVPVHYRLSGDAYAEGGDLIWLNEKTLAVGIGFRTNLAGYDQLNDALSESGVSLVQVHLPYFEGEEACLHLGTVMSVVDHDLVVAFEPLIPVIFWQYLQEQGFRIVPVPNSEWTTQGANVLALAPGKCLMLQENPVTQAGLEAAGCEVILYKGKDISFKAEGGATCLTRPVFRSY